MSIRYLLTASAFGLIAAIASRGSIFIANILLARHLGMEMYGLVSFAYLTALNIGGFISASLSQTAAKIVGKHSIVGGRPLYIAMLTFLRVSLGLIFVITVFVELIGIYLGSNVVSKADETVLFHVAAIILLLSTMASTSQGLLFSLAKYRKSSLYAVLASVVLLLSVIISIQQVSPLYSLMALGTGALVQATLGSVTIWRYIKNTVVTDVLEIESSTSLRETLIFLGPALLVAVVGAPVHWFCMTLLAHSPDGLKQMAIFNVAFQWYLIIAFIPSALANMSISFFSRFSSIDSEVTPARVLILTLSVVSVVALVVGFPIIIFPDVAASLYGGNYASASEIIRLLVIAAVIASPSLCLQQYIAAHGGIWKNFIFAVVYSALYIGFTVVAMRMDAGGYGIALGILLSAIFLLILQIIFIFKSKITFLRRSTL